MRTIQRKPPSDREGGVFVSRKPRDSRVVQKKASADDVEIETPFVVK